MSLNNLGRTPTMPDSATVTVDTEKDKEGGANDLVSAVVNHIEDDVKNAQTLRNWRPWIARLLLAVAAVFYYWFYRFIEELLENPCLLMAPAVCIAIVLALSLIPTMLLLTVAKAVFGSQKGSETPFSPMQALLNLMKEVKGS